MCQLFWDAKTFLENCNVNYSKKKEKKLSAKRSASEASKM